ncbi:MAG: hypothetical protein O7C01_11735 [Actinobacteria bacterium]|nr:hypothetical protein [Actinomycetota bacterium]
MTSRGYFRARFFKLGHDPMYAGRVDSAKTTMVATDPISGRAVVAEGSDMPGLTVVVINATSATRSVDEGEAILNGFISPGKGDHADRSSRFDWSEVKAALWRA